MDILDWIIVAALALSAIHGLRLGAAVQILSFGGSLLGLAIGVVLVSAVTPQLHGDVTRTFLSILLLLFPCVIFWAVGRHLGVRIWGRLQGHGIAHLDAAAGAAIAMAGTLVFAWVVCSVLVNSSVGDISGEIEHSIVMRGVTGVMPPIPTELASLEHLLDENGFPLPVVDFEGSTAPVKMPGAALVNEAVADAGRSTVQVTAYGCDSGYLVEKGSGFVTDKDLVVTNAHVVAGANHIVVRDEAGDYVATPIYYDPEFDLAVLKVPGILDPSLTIDPHFVGRGTKAVVLGYPGGGPFNSEPAGVLARLDATGLDIYNQHETTRWLYELQSLVRPGNSGGPLVEPDGLVIGVVFSRSATSDTVGFALSSPGVLRRVEQAEHSSGARVSTQRCTTE